jgi:hypothetical protein
VTAAVVERPVVPSGVIPLATIGARAAINREVGAALGNLTGGGESIDLSWRWWEHRPAFVVGVSAPAPFGGVWSLQGAIERESFGVGNAPIDDRRRSAVLRVSDWTPWDLAWRAALGVERINDATSAVLGGGVEHRSAGDRFSIGSDIVFWPGDVGAASASVTTGFRTRTRHEGHVWMLGAGGHAVNDGAPMTLWPGASTGQGRAPLLRAHPLLDDGIIRDGVFGRTLAHATVEWRHWRGPVLRVLRIAPAVFLDTAHAWNVPDFADARAHVDLGAGLRVAIPAAGVLRVDVARGLRDGQMALSFGFTRH